MPHIHSVAVFCGASLGASPAFRTAAEALGRGIARARWRLVYGGGQMGLMGVMANAALAEGGAVVGVIPDFLQRQEVVHGEVSELVVTASMHSRKRGIFDRADAFVSLPGGLGTLDETIEIITWRQLRLHDKPILLCNVMGSAGPLVAAVEQAVAQGFARPAVRDLFEVHEGVAAVLARLAALHAPAAGTSERL
ncbi:MAG: TIGR00730 family Rossman fold protein [Acetobacteraceae bacterium]|nr:TIGR00730 family Rossman fold protein [Acetobacteraceae bacterium]